MAFDLLVPAGGLAVLNVWGRIFGQETRTEFAFENVSPGDLSILTEITPNFADQHLDPLMTLATTDFQVYNIRGDAYSVTLGVPTALGFRDQATPIIGTRPPPAVPPQCALVLRRRVGTIGRANRGRVFWPGIPSDQHSGGVISGAYLASVTGVCSALSGGIVGGGGGLVLLRGVLLKKTPTGTIDSFQTISHWDPNVIVRTQRRREVGVGI